MRTKDQINDRYKYEPKKAKAVRKQFPKTLTAISGLDGITNEGFPTGRPTLICGSPGAGKTLFSLEFIFNSAKYINEPSVISSIDNELPDIIILDQNMPRLNGHETFKV